MTRHFKSYLKALDFCQNNELEFKVYHARTGSSYLTVYVLDTDGEICGECKFRFSDHKTNSGYDNTYDTSMNGCAWKNINKLLKAVTKKNRQMPVGCDYVEFYA